VELQSGRGDIKGVLVAGGGLRLPNNKGGFLDGVCHKLGSFLINVFPVHWKLLCTVPAKHNGVYLSKKNFASWMTLAGLLLAPAPQAGRPGKTDRVSRAKNCLLTDGAPVVLNLGHYKGAENGLEKALVIRKETLLQTPDKKPVPYFGA
jgi:hypothetical protein